MTIFGSQDSVRANSLQNDVLYEVFDHAVVEESFILHREIDLGLPKGDIRFGLQKGDGLLEFFLVDALGNQHGHASYPLPVSGSNSVQLSLMVINPENEPIKYRSNLPC